MVLIRELLYDEKILDEFDIESDKSVFKLFFELLLNMVGTRITDGDAEKKITSMFNDACFISNAVVQMKRPFLHLRYFRELASHDCTAGGTFFFNDVRADTVLCMVYFLLKEYDEKTSDIEKFQSIISTHLNEMDGESKNRYEVFDNAYNNSGLTYLSGEFIVKLPITQEKLKRICWSDITKDYDKELLKDIVCFWREPHDRNMIIDDIKKEIELNTEDDLPF